MASDRTVRGEIRSILDDAAKEMGFAVDSIRHEVIEKAWFGEELTPDAQSEWLRDDTGVQAPEIEGPQDHSMDSFYGSDREGGSLHDMERAQDRDQDIDR